jgi:hypothetical protein
MNHATGWRENRFLGQKRKISLRDIAECFAYFLATGMLCFELIVIFG